MNRKLIALVATAAAVLLSVPSAAVACSKDNLAYFDAFPDDTCLLPLVNTEIDTFGGVRLITDGAVVNTAWDTLAELTTGVTYESKVFAPVGTSTLIAEAPGNLELPPSALPLTPAGEPGLSPAAATWGDSDGVSDPSVVKSGSTYVMYYAGVAEDGSGPAIFRLTSPDGATWTRPADPAQHQPVLEGTPGTFDENGVYGPDVVLDPEDEAAPFKMWFSGHGDTFDQIGYATSADGITWSKRAEPVVGHGAPGSQDSFSAAHPSVLFDNGLWKMWYEGDDSNKKAIAYATSTDGIAWSKAGAVIESGSGNVEFGVFAPTVWREAASLKMLVGGRKKTNNVFQTKLINASSANGIDWTLGSIALNTAGFATSNLSSPEILPDGAGALRLYYSGNAANEGDARDRIGYSATGAGGTAAALPVLNLAPRSTTLFDAREVSGVAAVRPGGVPDQLAGVFTGLNEAGVPRLGAAHSEDRVTWVKDPGTGELGSLFPAGQNNQFDEDGRLEPSLFYEQDAVGDDYVLAFTGIEDGVRTIGVSTTGETATTLLPDHTSWSGPAELLGLGTTFDAAGVSHPSLVKLGAGSYAIYYTATAAGGATSFGRVTSTTPSSGFGNRAQVNLSGTRTCDPDAFRDPVVVASSPTDVDLYYLGVELVDADGDDNTPDVSVERTCHAHSIDGVNFTRTGVILNPSQNPYGADESGVAPASIVTEAAAVHMFTTVTDRAGRTRGGSATNVVPVPVDGRLPSGWATYQLGDETTTVRDFRFIEGVSTGDVELWMSYLQPYSDGTSKLWSRYFPVDAANSSLDLNFLLTIRGVRWQARMRDGAVAPTLDRVTIGHAPIHFAPTGSATTEDISPPEDFALQNWTTLTVVASGTGGASATVIDPEGNTLVGPTVLTVPGESTIPLSGIAAADEPKLRVRLDLTSAPAGADTPLVQQIRVGYAALQPGATATPEPTPSPTPAPTATPAPPPPPPPAVLTLAPAAKKIVYGRSTTLAGRLTVGAGGVAGRAIALLQQPVGTTTPKPLATLTTDATGSFKTTVKPKKKTTYSVVLAGVTSPAPVTVSVAHGLTLKVAVSGRRATFTGKVSPRHARRTVTIQRKRGTKWVRYARVRTTRRSTYRLAKRLARGRYQFRATTGSDRDHVAGRSPVRRARIR